MKWESWQAGIDPTQPPSNLSLVSFSVCEISGSHGGKYVDDSFVGYNAM
jgi:hypothetical protein